MRFFDMVMKFQPNTARDLSPFSSCGWEPGEGLSCQKPPTKGLLIVDAFNPWVWCAV